MKNKDLQELLRKYPDDMEVIFHYRSDLCVAYEPDFVIHNRKLDYGSFETQWKPNAEVYGEHMWNPYKPIVDYKDGNPIFGEVTLTKKDAIVLEVCEK